jgi:hypothetical protein
VRPRWSVELGQLLLALLLVLLITAAGMLLHWSPVLTPIASGLVFLATWLRPRMRGVLRPVVSEGEGR